MANLNLIICLISFFVCIVGVNLLLFLPNLINSMLDDELVLKQDSDLFEQWANIKLPIYVKFYFFNVLNPNEVEFNSQKPILSEQGPYVFLQKRNKNIFQFSDDEKEVIFNERKRYFFQPDLSVGKLDDRLTLPNIPKLIMASKAINDDGEDAAVFYDVIDAMFKKLDPPLFENLTVEQILFKGYKVEIFEEMKTMLKGFNMIVPKEIESAEFGLLYKKNGSTDLIWNVDTGLGKLGIFQVNSYNKSKSLNYWKTEQCNLIRGSDGSGFHRNLNEADRLYLFDPGLCKPAELIFERKKTINSVSSYRFVLSDKVFGSIVNVPENECYCVRPKRARDICSKEGVFDLSGCAGGAPLVISKPHFLNADIDLIEKIEDGLNSNKKLHQTYVDIEPNTGSVISAAKRIQFNIEVFRNNSLEGFANVQSMLLPIAWLEESFKLDDKMAEKLISLDKIILLSKMIPISLIIVTSLISIITTFLYYKKTRKVYPLEQSTTKSN